MFRTQPMAHLKKLQLLFIVLSITTLPLYSFDGSNSLITIPSAKLPSIGTTRVGLFNEVTLTSKANVSNLIFGSYAFSDFLLYSIQVSNEFNASHHLQSNPYSYIDVDNHIKYDVGIGAKNIHAFEDSDEYQKPSLYVITSIDLLKSKSTYHIGTMTKKNTNNSIYFMTGVEHKFKFGKLMADWDGTSLSFGINYEIWKNYELFASNTVPKENNPKSIIKLGLRFTGNNLKDAYRRPYFDKKDAEKSPIDPQLELSNLSIMNASTYHMQKGLQHYYQAEFDEALKEYKIVTSLIPENPINYIRLGSIYYQIGEKETAIEQWKKVLKLDPYNKEIRYYLKEVKKESAKDKKNNKELETTIENLIKEAEDKKTTKQTPRKKE